MELLSGTGLSAQAALTNSSVWQFTAGNTGTFATAAEAGASWFSWLVNNAAITYADTGSRPGADSGIGIGTAQPLPQA